MAKLIPGNNDLATVNPALAAELVEPALAETVAAGSGKKLAWFCDGTDQVPHPRYEWPAIVGDRVRGSGCPVCSGNAVFVGFNDLATVDPDLAAELVEPALAETVTAGSTKKLDWFCDGTNEVPHPRYEWPAIVGFRVRGSGCPVCSGNAVFVGFNDLATVDPALTAELVDPGLAKTSTAGADKKFLWFCDGTDDVLHPRYEWSSSVGERMRGRGCPVCSGHAVFVGFNDLTTVNPALAAELVDPSLAETVKEFSGKKLAWFCDGTDEVPHPRREWSAKVADRSKGDGCGVCSGNAVFAGFNDLATVNPGLTAELVEPALAVTVAEFSGKKLAWFCDGTNEVPHPRYEWSAKVASRSIGNGCAVCSGKAVLVGFNDLATVNPALAAELVEPALAATVTKFSGKKLAWFCDGTNEIPHPRREWSVSVNDRSRGIGCAACSGKAALAGFNDLATVNPALAAELVDPSLAATVTAGSKTKLRWFCDGTDKVPHSRYEWSANINNRSNGTGCAVCAVTGFDPSEPGWLYFLRHDAWGMQQIGITNDPDDRVGEHRRSGWELVDIRKYDNGALCAATETAALDALKTRGANLGQPGIDRKFSGYTEAWSTATLELEGLPQLLKWVNDDEW